MKLRNINAFIISAGVALSLTSCSEEAGVVAPQGREVTLSVNVTRGNQSTRSILSEEEGDLKCTWENTDLILVTDGSGKSLGVLKYKSGEENIATFEGTITTTDTGNVSYNFLYLGAKTEADLMALSNPLVLDYSEQGGTMEWLSSHDFFCASKEVSVSDSRIEVEDINLARQIAFGRFEIVMPDNVTYSGQDITISGEGIYNIASVSNTGAVSFSKNEDESITIKGVTGSDIYVAILPGAEDIAPTFSVRIDDVTYSATLDERTWTASEYVRKANKDDNGSVTSYSGMKLEMAVPSVVTKPDNTVGPVININGKNYKFVKGNLYYDMNDQSWHLYEKETYYRTLAGTSYLYGKQINGVAYNSSTNHEIDLFAWGATGLGVTGIGEDKGRAKTPDFIRNGYPNETLAGSNWPSYNTNTMDVNGNARITDLWKTYGYDDPVYDFGYAYMNNGRPSDDNRKYVTAPLAAYAEILDPEKNFAQGCIIKNAGITGGDAKGVLILFGITDVEEAKKKIQSVEGGKAPKLTKLLGTNLANRGFDFLIELPNYEAIEELGAMFFALGGSSNWASSQKKSTDCGAYWTKDAADGSSKDANAYSFFFRKISSASECNYIVGRSGVSNTRRKQNSVRLMVEVD